MLFLQSILFVVYGTFVIVVRGLPVGNSYQRPQGNGGTAPPHIFGPDSLGTVFSQPFARIRDDLYLTPLPHQ
ncbi:hypothetical protein AX14_000906 [Amanita brunnescens Koide BX004]|nr:hypothetical protein AX14_000906 [Amanita brunnescens Koide BX004]